MKIDLLNELKHAKTSDSLIDAVDQLFLNQFLDEKNLKKRLEQGSKNKFLPHPEVANVIESDGHYQVFSEKAIKKIATNYQLRFLDSDMFIPAIPELAFVKARGLEDQYKTKFDTYKILAPKEAFKTETAKDPLLFAQIADDKYVFIHKWGHDLSAWRKISRWPLRSPYHFAFSMLAFLIILTAAVPNAWFNSDPHSLFPAQFVFFFCAFMIALSWSVFGFLAFQKNFSCYIYNSRFNNR